MNRSIGIRKYPAYHSVEFSVEGIDFPYQFRIWESHTESMSVLVKNDSIILHRLKVGDILNMKYYSEDSAYPSENIRTAIRYVSEKNQGRLRGHSLVGLQIIN
jgi:hypothetical protein